MNEWHENVPISLIKRKRVQVQNYRVQRAKLATIRPQGGALLPLSRQTPPL